MKIHIKQIVIILVIIAFTSCEEVINIDVPTGVERLVIEASLDWQIGTIGNSQTIKLSTTSPYFDQTSNNAVTNATVIVNNTDTNETFAFVNQNDGTYITNSFVPILNNNYSLEVKYNGETYTAIETLLSTPTINTVTQSIEGGFDDELIEVNVFFNDPENINNYYIVRFQEEDDLFPQFFAIEDEFIDGNEVNVFFEKNKDEDENEFPLEVNDAVNIKIYNVSQRYFNYASLLFDQYENNGLMFTPVPVEIRGNCFNTTNSDNYPYGYFRVTQFDETNYNVN